MPEQEHETVLPSDYEYLFVARHGKVEDLAPVRAVARRLVETLKELEASPTRPSVATVEHADTEASRRTAEVFAEALRVPVQVGEVALSPTRFPVFEPGEAARELVDARRQIDERLKGGAEPFLLVGHQPAIDWLLCEWVDWGNQPVALASAELACLARAGADKPWHLWWVLTPTEAAAIEPLRQKIVSKMTVLSVLAGFTLAVTGALLIDLPDSTGPRLVAGAAATLFAVAASGYICVLLAYDELLMPHRFWHAGPARQKSDGPLTGHASRPPSSAGIVLYQHMVSLWTWVVRALQLSGVGVALLALAKVWPNGLLPCAAVVVVSACVAWATRDWWRRHRPRFGPQD
jgi:phosphohistidine phosphatase SixA